MKHGIWILISENTIMWIPLPPIDKGKLWTDAAIYKLYGLTDSEIRMIEKEMTKPIAATKTRKNVEPVKIEGQSNPKQKKQTKSKREKLIGNAKSKRASKGQRTKGGNTITRKFLSFFSH